MKKYLAILLILVTILSLASCAGKQVEPSSSPQASESAAISPTPSANPSPIASATAQLLAGEPAAPVLGLYLKQNAANLSAEDGNLLLERLLLAQLDLSMDMNNRIWDTPYMSALNDTLGGILDAAKIPNIKDDTVRGNFQKVADGMMTMVRYEETPVFEPDWAALEAMKDTFSAQAGVMIDYQSRLQGRYYFGDPYNFDLLAADIVAVEEALQNTDSGFVRWQLKYVYTVQVGRLLYGPEGSFLSMFMSGDKPTVSNIEKYAEQYSWSTFGSVCKNLLAKQSKGYEVVSSFISDSLIFPPGDTRGVLKISIDYNGAKIEVPQLIGMEDAAVMEKVNAAIMDTARALVISGRDNQTVNNYITFVNDNYVNVDFSYSYRDDYYIEHFSESYLMLDLNTGKSVSLDDLVGKPFKEYKDQLIQSIQSNNPPVDLKEPVHFMIDRNDFILSVLSDKNEWPDYFTITWNGLRSFMDISKLY